MSRPAADVYNSIVRLRRTHGLFPVPCSLYSVSRTLRHSITETSLNLPDLIKSDADQCVKCGLCLPHCPTYAKTRDEGDSPRGRIALMQGLAEGHLDAAGRLEFHLDRCLACRACEQVCPSGVRYGRLIDAARAMIEQRRRPPLPARLTRRLGRDQIVMRPRRLRAAARLLRLYERSGLQRVARGSGLLRALGLSRLDALLPRIPSQRAFRAYYPAEGEERGRVALFTGCLGNVFERDALRASIRLLNHCGYGVHVPPRQGCCGALHLHGGESAGAAGLARHNIATFNALDVEAVVYTSSGCGATLAEYGDWVADADGGERRGLDAPAVDLSRFITSRDGLRGDTPAPLNGRIAVHDPCTLRNVVRAADSPYELLSRIPGAAVTPLAGNARCCGAAGSYMLTQPEMAGRLREDKLTALRELNPDVLVTSNIGCALHLAAGIREAGMDIEVVHPVVLLERQMRGAGQQK